MKAAVQHKYGSPNAITIEDLPAPPADDQVLIRIQAATVGIVDTLARKGEPAYARIAHAAYLCLPETAALAPMPPGLSYAQATVTGVCSGANTEVVSKLGAETVIDYTKTDFTRESKTFDVIFDVAGKSSFNRCRAILNPGGIYLTMRTGASRPGERPAM